MRSLDAADLVVIASRTLGIDTHAVLAQLDVTAAQAALAEARAASRRLSAVAATDHAAAAAACVGLVHALLSHRVFPRQSGRAFR